MGSVQAVFEPASLAARALAVEKLAALTDVVDLVDMFAALGNAEEELGADHKDRASELAPGLDELDWGEAG